MKVISRKLPYQGSNQTIIQEDNPNEFKKLAFMARAMVTATLPHSKFSCTSFKRKNGCYSLAIEANPEFGLPYGSIPRMLLVWLTTEAVRKKTPEINLGNSLISFLKKLELQNGGGERGNATRVRNQLMRLLTCRISCVYYDRKLGISEGDQFLISRSYQLWWNPLKTKDEAVLAQSRIVLAKDFYEELIKAPIPIDFQTLLKLRRSPLQIDIYTWLTYRYSFLQEEVSISWNLLKQQFGSDYADDLQGMRNFKKKFIQAIKKVLQVYSTANLLWDEKGLKLFKSETHIKKKSRKNNSVDNQSYPR